MGFRRNMLIVLAHGLRSDAVGDSGVWPLLTPNMEKLAQRGMRLVGTSACPADPGGATSVYTGLHARQHGLLQQNALHPTCHGWAAALAEQGYHLAGVGMVAPLRAWLQEALCVEGIDSQAHQQCPYLAATRSKGITAALLAQRRQRQRSGPFEPDRLVLDPADDIDGYILDQAQRMLTGMPGDKPWALIVSLTGPANDLPPPTIYTDLVDPRHLETGFTLADFTRVDLLAELDYPRSMLQRLDPLRLGRIRSDYLGRVSLIDFGLGRLCDTLADRDDHTRTWTLVTSDRGQLLGEHGLIGHRSFLAGAIEVPVIITAPMPQAQTVSDGVLVSTVDVAATIADLGSADLSEAVIGRSLLNLMRGEGFTTGTGGACISEFGKRIMLETQRHKVIFHTDTHHPLGLFDLLNDPDECHNLAPTLAGQNLLDSFRWRLGDALMPLRAMGTAV